MALPGEAQSYWLASSERPSFTLLSGKAEADVAIIGGGWVGILAADLLKRAGRRVMVIEARHVAEQVTGHTTAKLTSLHGLIYADLVQSFGEAQARLYGEANQQAIEYVARVAQERHIDCDLERKAAYTFSEDGSQLEQVRQEAVVAERLGLPASFVTELPLPFSVAGAVRFDNQAQFHPLKFIRAIAASVPGDGCEIFEQTRALDIQEGNPHCIVTDRGTVRARDVIIATNLPFPMQGAHFARLFPYRHEVVGAWLPGDVVVDGMFLRADEPTYSIRTHRAGDRTLLIVVGPSFKTGTADTEKQVVDLVDYLRNRFGVTDIAFRWGNQDYFSPDRVPFVGRLTQNSHHIYMASGFGAWGLTNGVVAAMILSNRILEQRSPWAELYDSTRLHVSVTGRQIAEENLQVAVGWIKDRLKGWQLGEACDVLRGEGALCKHNGEVTAVYKSPEGELHYLSPACTHLGCHVSWNRAEQSWDCPCHGSRFSPEGKLLSGPAVRDLKRRE